MWMNNNSTRYLQLSNGVRIVTINRLSHAGGASDRRCRITPVVLNLALTAADGLPRKSCTFVGGVLLSICRFTAGRVLPTICQLIAVDMCLEEGVAEP